MTSLDRLNDDFRDLLSALCAENAEFLIVGAYALAFHGLPRATGDIDVLVNPTPSNAERVQRALLAFGAPLKSAEVSENDWVNPDMVFQIGTPPRRIDILTGISGMDFATAWAGREPAQLGECTVNFLGRTELIENKRAAGRLKDLADVESLERGNEER